MVARAKVPEQVERGVPFKVRTLIDHVMENGERIGPDGAKVPRHIIHRFVCRFGEDVLVDLALGPSVSQDPYLEFDVAVERSGVLRLEWHDDDGTVTRLDRRVEASG